MYFSAKSWFFKIQIRNLARLQNENYEYWFIAMKVAYVNSTSQMTVAVSAQRKVWACGRSLAAIAVSNPTNSTDICLLWVLCIVRYSSMWRSDHSSARFLPSVVCLTEIVKPQQWGGPVPLGIVVPKKKSDTKLVLNFAKHTRTFLSLISNIKISRSPSV